MNADNRIWHPEQMDLILDADAVYRTVAGPKLFFITPFFTGMAAKLQQKVEYEGRSYRIGGIHPFPLRECLCRVLWTSDTAAPYLSC